MRNILSVVSFCIVIFFSSCSETKYDEWIGKAIYFPNTLYELKNEACFPLDDFYIKTKGKKKVVSIIDATCIKCIIDQLNRIDSLFIPLLRNKGVEVIFVLNINSADSLSFMTSLYPAIKANRILLWDNAYHFETVNDIFTEKASRRTFLLDENNKIIQIGNPLYDKRILDLYQESLK